MSYRTNINYNKREQLKSIMDDFTSFWWGNDNKIDMFECFGAFIVGGKNALKFYNGPSFKNQYAKPQFSSAASLLTGVDFEIQKIEFTMGVYWFTIEEYRELLLVLHPYEVNDLTFSFAPEWRYYVKLSGIKDSNRDFIGYDQEGNRRYYTEIKLTFEVQGDACAKARSSFDLQPKSQDGEADILGFQEAIFELKNTTGLLASDLDTPFVFSFDLRARDVPIYPLDNSFPAEYLLPIGLPKNEGYYVHLTVAIPAPAKDDTDIIVWNQIGVCSFYLNNLSWSENSNGLLKFSYDSATGLVTMSQENYSSLVSLSSSVSTGRRLLQALETNKCFLPGVLSSPVSPELFNKIQFRLYYTNNLHIPTNQISFECYARTNII